MIKIYSDKKVQEIESYLLNRHKPILLVIGTSGIGKFTAMEIILKKHNYSYLYVSQYVRNQYFAKQKNSFQYALQLQLDGLDDREAIILRDLEDPSDIQEFRNIQQMYVRNQKSQKPLILILNSTITRDFQMKRILSQQFLDSQCQIVQFIPPTKPKIEMLLKQHFQIYQQSLIKEIAELSNGNLGITVNQIYLLRLGKQNANTNKMNPSNSGQLSIFNLLGRVLYNKRLDQHKEIRILTYKEMITSPQPEWYFNPFDLVEKIQITQQAYRGFIYQNSINFFACVQEYQRFLEIFEEIDILDKNNFNQERDVNQKMSNEIYFSQLITIGYMGNNLKIGEKARKMNALQGPIHYEIYKLQQLMKSQLRELRGYKKTQVATICKILGKPFPKINIQRKYFNSDESNINQEWFSEPTNEQNPMSQIPKLGSQRFVVRNGRELISFDRKQILLDNIESLMNQ